MMSLGSRRDRFVLSVLVFVILTGCSSHTWLAPAPSLYTDATLDYPDPFPAVPPSLRTTHADVIFATDRRVDGTDAEGNTKYGCGRCTSLSIGTCRVEFGERLDWQGLVPTSRESSRPHPVELRLCAVRPAATFAETGKPPTDGLANPKADDIAASARAQEEDAQAVATLHRLLAERLADSPRREVFLYVHGYDNTIEDGALRIAQIWHFLGRLGVPVLYSWPAGYSSFFHGYTHDRESGEFTVYHLKQFLVALASCPQVDKVHFVAHSRGADVLMSALRELHIETHRSCAETRKRLKIGNIVLVAPDLDMEVAAQRIAAEGLGSVPERATVYMNAKDRAIDLAAWLFASLSRLGMMTPADMSPEQREAYERLKEEISFIEVDVHTDFWGHSYFISNPSVLSDLILLLRDGDAPGTNHRKSLVDRGSGFWELHEGYPHEEQAGR